MRIDFSKLAKPHDPDRLALLEASSIYIAERDEARAVARRLYRELEELKRQHQLDMEELS